MSYWWVNQGKSYRPERRAGILYAPLFDAAGRRPVHWEALAAAVVGDVVLHYADQHIRAVGTVTQAAEDAPRPYDLPNDRWEDRGRLVRVRYIDAEPPVHREEIPLERRLGHPATGPFQGDGAVKLGYLWPLTEDFGDWFTSTFASRTR